jgi:HlyD family secretion protein
MAGAVPQQGSGYPKMDIQRKNVGRKKAIRWTITGVVLLAAVGGISYALTKLKPAAPSVEMSALWPDQVKRGPMVLDVRGLGTLVPEDTMLITAQADARVERILVRPGAEVHPDTVIMEMTSPDLETAVLSAHSLFKASQADYDNLRVTQDKATLDMKSKLAQVESDYATAKLQAERDMKLAKDGLVSDIDAQISAQKAVQLKAQLGLENERLKIYGAGDEAALAAAKVKVEQMQGEYELKKGQLEQIKKVRAGFAGTLQALAAPLVDVEEGQKVVAGAALGKVAQRLHLKAQLKIAETQVKDIVIGLPAVVDTRLAGGGSNGMINGTVSRIDPSILNGTVTVDVALKSKLPEGARPDLSVDGTIQLMKLDDVVYVGRPVFGQQDQTVRLFKIEPDGKYANAIKVAFGRSSVSTIEIKSGLNVGDRVILSDMSAYDAYDRIKLN